eukprot:sb/3461709/
MFSSLVILIYTLIISLSPAVENTSSTAVLTPVVPGVNLPSSQILPYLGTLLLAGIFHEAGHALAAAREGVSLVGSGLFLFLIYPAAFVELNTSALRRCDPFQRLRITSAGVWHNCVMMVAAYSLWTALPLLLPVAGFHREHGAVVTSVQGGSALSGQVHPGSVITRVNRCEVGSREEWSSCLWGVYSEGNRGRCLGEEDLATHTITEQSCCEEGVLSARGICFTSSHGDGDFIKSRDHDVIKSRGDVTKPDPDVCLHVRPLLSKQGCARDSDCLGEGKCYTPHSREGHLIQIYQVAPSSKSSSQLGTKPALFIGDPAHLFHTLSTSDYSSLLLWRDLPNTIEMFLMYMVSLSGALAIFNAVPGLFLDGQHMLEAFLDLVLGGYHGYYGAKEHIMMAVIVLSTFDMRFKPTETSKQPIRSRYLDHVTGYQPIRDQYFLIRSVPLSTMLRCLCSRLPTRLPTLQSTFKRTLSFIPKEPERRRRLVGYWLLGCCGLVATTVSVGGITRLTESGLSMTDWKFAGRRAPRTQAEWEIEFDKYKASPQWIYQVSHSGMTLEQFKFIWYMEWGHRHLGRVIGLCLVLPTAGLLTRPWVTPALKKRLVGFSALVVCQGLLGWYMVQSGLEDKPESTDIPRVSQYRLASHLGSAFILYLSMFKTSLDILLPAQGGGSPALSRLRVWSGGVAGLAFLTALSGAFVAGLDAGLVYNSYPKFADRWIPSDLLSFSPTWSNFFENTTTVQFDHRLLGHTLLLGICGIWLASQPLVIPGRARFACNALMAMGWVQVGLGVSTLLLHVPTWLAATHQQGSLVLLTLATWMFHELGKKKVKLLQLTMDPCRDPDFRRDSRQKVLKRLCEMILLLVFCCSVVTGTEIKVVESHSQVGHADNTPIFHTDLPGKTLSPKIPVTPATNVGDYRYRVCPFHNVTQHEIALKWNSYNGILDRNRPNQKIMVSDWLITNHVT